MHLYKCIYCMLNVRNAPLRLNIYIKKNLIDLFDILIYSHTTTKC